MTAAMRTKVTLFYDVISPYTWFGFEVLCRYRPHWKNMDLDLCPVLRGGIEKESGNSFFSMIPSKMLYMQKDLERSAAYFGIPLKPIEDPFHVIVEKGSLKPQRFLTAIRMSSPQYLEETSRQLWMRVWSKGEDITEDQSLIEAGNSAKMSNSLIEDCLQKMKSPAVKEALKAATVDAVEHGAFGTPVIVVHMKSGPEMFFGSDRFHLIAPLLNEEWRGPFPDSSRSKL